MKPAQTAKTMTDIIHGQIITLSVASVIPHHETETTVTNKPFYKTVKYITHI